MKKHRKNFKIEFVPSDVELTMKLSGKKDFHVEIPYATYVRMKIACFERQMNPSEFLGGICTLIARDDSHAFKILDDLALLKYRGLLHEYIFDQPMDDAERERLYAQLEEQDRNAK